jgi:hypothetical protein
MEARVMSGWPSQTRPSYAGIGSRKTPPEIRKLIAAAARVLAERGWVLRTGLAPGADQAFYLAARNVGPVELFLPWPRFERGIRDLTRELDTHALGRATDAARQLAEQHHPAWGRLTEGARRLHARNCHQILGADLSRPARFVLCWTPDASLDGRGSRVGGTGQALRLAHQHQITVFNLANTEHRQRVTRTVTVAERQGRNDAGDPPGAALPTATSNGATRTSPEPDRAGIAVRQADLRITRRQLGDLRDGHAITLTADSGERFTVTLAQLDELQIEALTAGVAVKARLTGHDGPVDVTVAPSDPPRTAR